MSNPLIFNCPHCEMKIIVEIKDLNCHIFRHAVYKETGEPIPPHAPKEECDKLFDNGLIYGCGKPFRINGNNDIEVCDYI